MRDILFRGKRMDNGEWIFGYYSQKRNLFSEDGLPVSHCISDDPPFGAKVDQETVGQYTGLEDKNGKRIFEGDIVEGLDYTAEDGGYGIIGFDEGAFYVSNNDICGTFYDSYWGKDFEVIGNVYDNPELRGGEEE